jgi:hypothetical protein
VVDTKKRIVVWPYSLLDLKAFIKHVKNYFLWHFFPCFCNKHKKWPHIFDIMWSFIQISTNCKYYFWGVQHDGGAMDLVIVNLLEGLLVPRLFILSQPFCPQLVVLILYHFFAWWWNFTHFQSQWSQNVQTYQCKFSHSLSSFFIHACSIGKECFKLQYLQCKWTHSLFMWVYIDNLTCFGCFSIVSPTWKYLPFFLQGLIFFIIPFRVHTLEEKP